MKIMVITADHITDHMGGTRLYTHELNKFLVKRRNVVKHVCYLGAKTENITIDGVTVNKISRGKKTGFIYYVKKLLRVRRFVKSCYRSFNPDIVLVDSARIAHHLLWNVIKNKEIVYFVHAMNSHEIVYNSKTRRGDEQSWLMGILVFSKVYSSALAMWILEEILLSTCSKIITVSNFDLSEINRFHGGRFNNKVDIIPIGIDLDKYKVLDNSRDLRKKHAIPREKCVFITIRRLAPRMGIENLLEAIASLERDDFILLLCGKGELEGKVKDIIESKNLQDKVRYLGYVSETKKLELLCAADISVLPTKELEGFGIVILESLATNTPVIGTPVGAIPQVLQGIGKQFITDDATPPAIQRKLLWAIENLEIIVETDHYRAIAEKYYDWKKIVIDIEKSLGEVIDKM